MNKTPPFELELAPAFALEPLPLLSVSPSSSSASKEASKRASLACFAASSAVEEDKPPRPEAKPTLEGAASGSPVLAEVKLALLGVKLSLLEAKPPVVAEIKPPL